MSNGMKIKVSHGLQGFHRNVIIYAHFDQVPVTSESLMVGGQSFP